MEAASGTGPATPAPGLSGSALDLLGAALRAVEAKDLPALTDLLTDDAVFVDPHYPTPRMVGRAAIDDGLRWAFGTIEAFRFETVLDFDSRDGRHAAVEVTMSCAVGDNSRSARSSWPTFGMGGSSGCRPMSLTARVGSLVWCFD